MTGDQCEPYIRPHYSIFCDGDLHHHHDADTHDEFSSVCPRRRISAAYARRPAACR